jgi:outer membrane protein assembly factor BamB
MSGCYGTLRENAARAPGTCHLEAPLREAWSSPILGSRDEQAPALLAASGRLVLCGKDGRAQTVDAESRKALWSYPWPSSPAMLVHDGHLLDWISDHELHVVDLETGRTLRTIHAPRAVQALAAGPILVGTGTDDEYGGERLQALDWTTGRRLWTEPLPAKARLVGPMTASEELLLYTLVEGDEAVSMLVGRRPDTGKELWRKPEAFVSGVASIHSDRVVGSTGYRSWAFALRDGSLLWENKAGWRGYLYGDRLYVRGDLGRYSIVDVRTGELVRGWDLRARMPRSLRDRIGLGDILLVSETHVFLGSQSGGALLSFTRDSGEYVGSHQPTKALLRGEAAGVDGRLYYQNGFQRLFCLEPRA